MAWPEILSGWFENIDVMMFLCPSHGVGDGGSAPMARSAIGAEGSLKARSHCTCFMVMKQDETGQ